jgi:hypothetical protein
MRHWDNAENFLTPGAQGASNPYLYQLYLFLVQRVTHEDRVWIGIVTACLSVFLPLFWYLFARSVLRRPVNALRYASILCWLPSNISIFGFFMNETLLLPLMGLALWLTQRTLQKRTAGSFIAMAITWTLGVLTRSVVGPVGLVCVAVSWLRLRRGRWLALAVSSAATAGAVSAASIHAHSVLNRYTPFGDNAVVAIYFVSGAHQYMIDFKGYGVYGFASPSLYLSPFYPFAEFQSIRKGVVSFSLDPDLRGSDIQETLRQEAELNRGILPRLIFENVHRGRNQRCRRCHLRQRAVDLGAAHPRLVVRFHQLCRAPGRCLRSPGHTRLPIHVLRVGANDHHGGPIPKAVGARSVACADLALGRASSDVTNQSRLNTAIS